MFITKTDDNSPAKYAAEAMAQFAIQQGVSKYKVDEWQNQLKLAEDTGHFAYTNLPILTWLSKLRKVSHQFPKPISDP